jgi:hypothetical protein
MAKLNPNLGLHRWTGQFCPCPYDGVGKTSQKALCGRHQLENALPGHLRILNPMIKQHIQLCVISPKTLAVMFARYSNAVKVARYRPDLALQFPTESSKD